MTAASGIASREMGLGFQQVRQDSDHKVRSLETSIFKEALHIEVKCPVKINQLKELESSYKTTRLFSMFCGEMTLAATPETSGRCQFQAGQKALKRGQASHIPDMAKRSE